MPGSTGRCSPTAGRTRHSPPITATRGCRGRQHQGHDRPPDARAREGQDPAQRAGARSGPSRWRRRTTPTPRHSRLPGRSRERAGPDGLRAVWADARIGRQRIPAGAAAGDEIVGGPVDWRGLLDLLEARTDTTYDDLWRTWVARPEDVPLLDARARRPLSLRRIRRGGRRVARPPRRSATRCAPGGSRMPRRSSMAPRTCWPSAAAWTGPRRRPA